jgi:hypothetical protein
MLRPPNHRDGRSEIKQLTIRIPEEAYEILEAISRDKAIPVTVLARSWINERAKDFPQYAPIPDLPELPRKNPEMWDRLRAEGKIK